MNNNTNSFSDELHVQQEIINKLLVQLDSKSQDGRLADDLKENITDLIDQLSGNLGGIQGDLVSLMNSFRNGKISAEELEMMIKHESLRSQFLLTESIDMKKVMKSLFSQFSELVDKIDASDPVASTGIDDMYSNMNGLLGSINLLTTGIVTSGSDIHRVIASKTVQSIIYDNRSRKKSIIDHDLEADSDISSVNKDSEGQGNKRSSDIDRKTSDNSIKSIQLQDNSRRLSKSIKLTGKVKSTIETLSKKTLSNKYELISSLEEEPKTTTVNKNKNAVRLTKNSSDVTLVSNLLEEDNSKNKKMSKSDISLNPARKHSDQQTASSLAPNNGNNVIGNSTLYEREISPTKLENVSIEKIDTTKNEKPNLNEISITKNEIPKPVKSNQKKNESDGERNNAILSLNESQDTPKRSDIEIKEGKVRSRVSSIDLTKKIRGSAEEKDLQNKLNEMNKKNDNLNHKEKELSILSEILKKKEMDLMEKEKNIEKKMKEFDHAKDNEVENAKILAAQIVKDVSTKDR